MYENYLSMYNLINFSRYSLNVFLNQQIRETYYLSPFFNIKQYLPHLQEFDLTECKWTNQRDFSHLDYVRKKKLFP